MLRGGHSEGREAVVAPKIASGICAASCAGPIAPMCTAALACRRALQDAPGQGGVGLLVFAGVAPLIFAFFFLWLGDRFQNRRTA